MSNRKLTAELSIVIPRSCSSSRLSRKRSLPASRVEMMLLDDRSESAKEVLPWSTCATIVTLRVLASGAAYVGAGAGIILRVGDERGRDKLTKGKVTESLSQQVTHLKIVGGNLVSIFGSEPASTGLHSSGYKLSPEPLHWSWRWNSTRVVEGGRAAFNGTVSIVTLAQWIAWLSSGPHLVLSHPERPPLRDARRHFPADSLCHLIK